MNKNDYQKIKTLLPQICPDVKFSLISQDDNLVSLGLCDSAPCIVEFDLSAKEFNEMLDELDDIEVNAFSTPNKEFSQSENLAYQKYLKYGCLYQILYNAKK